MSKPKTKKILIVNQSAPYSSGSAKESLDLALAAGTFEQDVSILFTGDACYQLLAAQNPSEINSKNLNQMLKVLPIYGVESLFVDEQSLLDRNIKHLDESLKVTKISSDETRELYRKATTVFRF
ncbi:MAG: tRNA 2-thiouridine synthesizing protein C [Pseudohongiellaceae bacterium]|jgi:tRNA 2-thiouridine synthesizing protein C